MNNKNKKIGLALSGGGAMGMAHIGVLKELDKHNIKIDAISGTSCGAIIGLLYAIGGTEKIESFIAYLDGAGIFSKKFIFPGDVHKTIKTAFVKYLGCHDFSETKIPFSCVATDIQKAETVVLEKGNAIDAVMASAAYPGVFPPVKIDGRILIDGGVLKNLPASVLKHNGMDFIIGSTLDDIKDEKDGFGFGLWGINRFNIMSRSIDIMQARLTKTDIRDCDFVFSPPMNDFKWFNFNKISEIQKTGADYASKQIAYLLDKLK